MLVDHERAWVLLGEFAASKTQHGREGLLTKMAEILAECQVPAGQLSMLLRLHGVEVERARQLHAGEPITPVDRDDFEGGPSSPADVVVATQHGPGGHDGYERSTSDRGTGDATYPDGTLAGRLGR